MVGVVGVAVQPSGTWIARTTPCAVEPPPLVNDAETVDGVPAGTTGGAALVNVPPTTIGAVPETPPTVTLMVAVPSLTARTRPAAETVATLGSLLA